MKDSLINVYEFFDFDSKEPINRLAYTDIDIKFKCKIIRKMQEIGMKVSIDNIGNICGEIGESKNKKSILIGSHTDSVPNGGQYDGSVGVIAGLKAIEKLLKNTEKIDYKIKLIIYACEESSRFNIACIGSKFLNNKLKEIDIKNITDKEDIRLEYAIKDAKYFIEKNKQKYRISDIEYIDKVIDKKEENIAIELHIEQYDSLYNENKDIGIVTSVVAPLRMLIDIRGEQGHTGATPMDKRKDAVVAGAIFVNKMNLLANNEENHFRATIPKFETKKWNANVIQDEVSMFLDIRLQFPSTPEDVEDKIKKVIKNIEKETRTKFIYKIITADTPTELAKEYNKDIIQICKKLNLDYKIMPSWAGHDIANVPANKKILIFIPSQGLSHNPNEQITEKDLNNGINVLSNLLDNILKEGGNE